MKLVIPNKINIVETSIPEDDAPTWNSSTTYAADADIMLEHRLYKSLKAGNAGKDPRKTLSGTDAWWRDMGATNRWRMFDDTVATQTTKTGEGEQCIRVKVRFDRATGFAMLNVTAIRIVVNITEDGDTEPYWTHEFDLLKPAGNYWSWYFDPLEYVRDVVATDIPICVSGVLEVALYGAATIGCGLLVAGKQRDIGATLYGISAGLRSYTSKETDDFGTTRIIRRRTAKRHSGELFARPRAADSVFALLTDMDGIPALWIGDNRDQAHGGYQLLTVYGTIEEFTVVPSGPEYIQIDIDIQGLV